MYQRKTLIEGYQPTPQRWRRLNRELIFNSACELAREDDQFRRDLLAVLKTSGRGKRGRVAASGEHRHLLTAYKNALSILQSDDEKVTKKAVIEMLIQGPFNCRSPDALEKLIRNLLKDEAGTK